MLRTWRQVSSTSGAPVWAQCVRGSVKIQIRSGRYYSVARRGSSCHRVMGDLSRGQVDLLGGMRGPLV